MADLIDRQQAIDDMQMFIDSLDKDSPAYKSMSIAFDRCIVELKKLTTAQPERDIPKKPISTTDRAWGIPLRQAVCPNCDVYLGMIHFISENGKTKVTYCETCGQAIDWGGWDYDG